MSHILKTFSFLVLISIFGLSFSAAAQDGSLRRALLIGMKDYKDTVGPLQNTHKDVQVMADALRAAGFEVDLLLDDVGNGVTVSRSKILAKLRTHAQALSSSPDAISFVYYSGHGAANEEDNRNYIIPQNVESIATAELWDESLKLQDAIDRLTNNAPAAAHFVVFDACRNELKLPTESRNLSKGFVAEQAPGGVFLAFSTAEGQVAQDGQVGDVAGPFAKALSEQIRVGGQNHVTMFLRAAQQVKQSVGQSPYIETGLLQEIYLNGTAERERETSANNDATAPSDTAASSDTSTSPALSQRKALIISNSDYNTPFTALPEASSTGERVTEAMLASGFDVTSLQDPTRADLLSAATQMLTSFQGDAFEKLAVIHYIGHVKALSDSANRGLTSGGSNYLIPAKAPIRSSFDLPIHAVELGKLMDLASAQSGVSSVFIVDGCRQDEVVAITGTENCVPEPDRENVMMTITTIDPVDPSEALAASPDSPTDDGSGTPPMAPAQSYSDRFAEELIVGGSITDVVRQTTTKQAVATGELSTQTSGSLGKSYEIAPVRMQVPLQGLTLSTTTCFDAVQNKIAWDVAGTRNSWNADNIAALCKGRETSVEPAKCFEQYMVTAREKGASPRWQDGSELCVGTNSAATTNRCFEAQIRRGSAVAAAIDACKADL